MLLLKSILLSKKVYEILCTTSKNEFITYTDISNVVFELTGDTGNNFYLTYVVIKYMLYKNEIIDRAKSKYYSTFGYCLLYK